MTQPARGSVRFRNVRKCFGTFTAIHDLDLDIEPGTLVTLLGPSGCGKTTTLRMLAGLETPTSGSIEIGGRDVTRLPANERDVAMVFQSYALFPHMSVLDNVAYGLQAGGQSKAEARENADAGLTLVGLGGYGGRLPAELSGGQQQRVAVARALVLEPQVLLLDEPLSNLDARLRRRVRTEIRELQQRLGFTAVYVTHDQEEALAVSDRIVVMDSGRIAQQGPPRELYEAPVSEFIADFMGEANVLPCQIVDASDGRATIEIGGFRHSLAARAATPGPAKLAVRANAITLTPETGTIGTGTPGTGNRLPGRIQSSAYLGDHVEYEVELENSTIFVIDTGTADPLPPGADVSVGFRDRGIALIAG
ncbi:ABC transporter ATP-binding protein [Stappia indica]|uniref:ABC transporter ATP-binding protein n=1 Tax=Stappia indica TaxID=538381 RepID=UPI001CD7E642|nr:ABC transporter ATP-binding protein [Stappia indica]MCA1299470.1 ABC transporter ATP-binding protein [Stappia indica]